MDDETSSHYILFLFMLLLIPFPVIVLSIKANILLLVTCIVFATYIIDCTNLLTVNVGMCICYFHMAWSVLFWIFFECLLFACFVGALVCPCFD